MGGVRIGGFSRGKNFGEYKGMDRGEIVLEMRSIGGFSEVEVCFLCLDLPVNDLPPLQHGSFVPFQ